MDAVGMRRHHGSFDGVVSPEFGSASKDRLLEAGYRVDWRTYPMEHQVSPEQIADIGRWLNERLPAMEAGTP